MNYLGTQQWWVVVAIRLDRREIGRLPIRGYLLLYISIEWDHSCHTRADDERAYS
jgi:hypothetical protein